MLRRCAGRPGWRPGPAAAAARRPRPCGGGQVADHEDLRMAGKGQVGSDRHGPAPALLAGDQLGQRVGPDAGGPHHRAGRDGGAVLEADALGGHLGQLGVEAGPRCPWPAASAGRPPARRREPGQEVVGHLDQHHPGLGEVQVVEVGGQVVADQLRQGAGHLHAGGAAADQDDGQGAGPAPPDPARVGLLERVEHMVAQPDGVGRVFSGKACSSTPGIPKSVVDDPAARIRKS